MYPRPEKTRTSVQVKASSKACRDLGSASVSIVFEKGDGYSALGWPHEGSLPHILSMISHPSDFNFLSILWAEF